MAALDEDTPPGAEFDELPQESIVVDVIVRPSDISAGGPYTISEDESESLVLSAAAVGTPLSFSWDVNGDGVFGDAVGENPTLTWAQLQSLGITDSGPQIVSVRARYASRVTQVSDPTALNIVNVAPTAELNNDGPVSEGDSGVSVSFVNQLDPSAADMAEGFSYSYDLDNDGDFEQTDVDQASFTVPAQYLRDDGTHTVRALIRDKDGDSTEYFTDIIIQQVAPQLTLIGLDSVAEGADYKLTLDADDPGDDTISQWIVDWGDGTAEAYGPGTESAVHQFADDGQRTISVSALDEDGIYTATKSVTVGNAVPVLSIPATPASIVENEFATLSVTIADPGVRDSFVLEVTGVTAGRSRLHMQAANDGCHRHTSVHE